MDGGAEEVPGPPLPQGFLGLGSKDKDHDSCECQLGMNSLIFPPITSSPAELGIPGGEATISHRTPESRWRICAVANGTCFPTQRRPRASDKAGSGRGQRQHLLDPGRESHHLWSWPEHPSRKQPAFNSSGHSGTNRVKPTWAVPTAPGSWADVPVRLTMLRPPSPGPSAA